MSRSLRQLLVAFHVGAASEVRLASLDARGDSGRRSATLRSLGEARFFAVSTVRAEWVDAREYTLLEAAGAVTFGGSSQGSRDKRLVTLWADAEHAAQKIYGEDCRVVSSYRGEGRWHASVLGPLCPKHHASQRGLSIYFETDGEDECGVLLEIAAFINTAHEVRAVGH